jgi:hydroxypyruvate reductase
MIHQDAKALVRELFLKTLPHLAVGPRMKKMVHLRDGVLEIAGDRIALHEGRPVRVVALGKAAIEMAHTLAEIMQGVRLRGVVAAPSLPKAPLPGFEYFAGGHPYPNEQSWEAAEVALTLLTQKKITSEDLIIFLVSGGGSSLMELPIGGGTGFHPTLEDVQALYEVLVRCGAKIEEMNAIRKLYSAVKGGRLAQAACGYEGAANPELTRFPMQVTMYVSDVPENSPFMIASGPSMPDETTRDDCYAVFTRYHLLPRLPKTYSNLWFSERISGMPKPYNLCFSRSRYYCVLSNWDAVEKLEELLDRRGVVVEIDNRCDEWKVGDAADYLLARLGQLRDENPGKAVAIVSGGELRCPVTGDGIGGRNQAFVLDCVPKIADQPIVVLSGGTDGIDGNSPATGAVADGDSLSRAQALEFDPERHQRRSDSYTFFNKLGDTIVTGPTGTNVRDLRLLLAYPE